MHSLDVCFCTKHQPETRLTYCILVGPQFPADHSREAYIWAGVSRNISCFPRAQPSATVEWMRFGQTIVNNDTYHIVNTANASYLQVLYFSVLFFQY